MPSGSPRPDDRSAPALPDGPAPLDRGRIARRLAAEGCPGPVRVVARTDTTQARARTAALAGAPAGWSILAEEQTEGRGRTGRSWWAPPRTAILASMVLRPQGPTEGLPGLSLAMGVAVAQALQAAGLTGVSLKWPNDVLVGDRKLAGILVEAVAAPAAPAQRALILGVGCNVAIAAPDLPAPIRQTATSCLAEGLAVDRSELAGAILAGCWRAQARWSREGMGWAVAAWRRLDRTRGQLVEAVGADGPIRGRVEGITAAGCLRLRTAAGPVTVDAGEVRRLRVTGSQGPAQVLDEPLGGA